MIYKAQIIKQDDSYTNCYKLDLESLVETLIYKSGTEDNIVLSILESGRERCLSKTEKEQFVEIVKEKLSV